MRKAFFVLSVLGLLLSSCDTNRHFEQNYAVPESTWKIGEKVRFEVPDINELVFYNVYINLRNGSNYGYSNFFIFMDIQLPDNRVMRDTIECPLADDRGKWYGQGMGDVIENQILIKRKFKFPVSGNYTFTMEQGMRQEEVPEIKDIGLRIEVAQ